MIDHRYRTIFIHQRKVAGLSISRTFGFTKTGAESGRPSDRHRYNEGVLSAGWRRRREPVASYFVFSAVRNPFDRLISSWRYLAATRDRPLLDVLRDPPREGHDYRHLTRPQVAVLRDPVSGKLAVDDLVRFETLQEDFDRICDRIGKPRTRLPHDNAGERRPGYHDYFDANTRRIAEDMFREDLETFGYDF